MSEYAYILRPQGKLYTCTDVKDLHEWMVLHLDAHPLFRRLTAEECEADPCVPCVMNDTEEGIKVARNKGDKYLAVYERLVTPRVDGKDWDGFDPMLSLVQPKDGKKEDEEDAAER